MFNPFVRWVLFSPIQTIICCIGIPGNVISALVWSRLKNKGQLKNKSVCNNFILLSIVDLGVLIFSILSDVLPVTDEDLIKDSGGSCLFGYVLKYFIHPAHFYFLFSSIYLVTVLSVERLNFVVRPLSRLTFSKSWSRALWLSVFLIAFVVNIPTFFEYEIVKDVNITYCIAPVDYVNNIAFRNIVFFSHCIFGLAIPWFISLLCNIILVGKTFNRLRNRHSSSTVNSETRHILKTTSAITFSSLILLSVQCISRCFKMFILSKNQKNWALIQRVAYVGHLAIPLNATINFIMYCLPGSYFRKEMTKMFRRVKD